MKEADHTRNVRNFELQQREIQRENDIEITHENKRTVMASKHD